MDIEKDINYIYNYIKYVYSSVDEFKSENYLIDISRRIKIAMINSDFTTGKLDFYINNFVGQELRVRNSSSFRSYEIIKNHIYLLMNYYKIYHGVNINNYSVVLYELTRLISSKYTGDEVATGMYDSDIESLIQSDIQSGFNPTAYKIEVPLNILYISSKNGEVVDNKEVIKKYIYKYLTIDIDKVFEFDGDLSYLVDLITNEICKCGVKVSKFLAHEKDDLINYYVRNNLFGIRYTELYNQISVEVSNYVNSNETYMDLPNKSDKISEEIYKLTRYLITLGYVKEDIITEKCNDIMEYHLRLDCIMVNSTICKNNEKGKQNFNKFPLYLNKTFSSVNAKPLIFNTVTAIMSVELNSDENNDYASNEIENTSQEILDTE